MSKQPLGRPLCSPTVEKLLLEIEGQPVRTHQRKQTAEPKNYTKENIKRLKEIQAICREKNNSPRNPMRVLPSSEIHVQPCRSRPVSAKQKQIGEPFLTTLALVPSTKLPVQSNARSAPSSRAPLATCKVAQSNGPLPRSNSESSLIVPSSPDTSYSVPGHQMLVRSPSASQLAIRKPALKTTLPHDLGKVPKYLQVRKLQWKHEEDERKRKSEEQMIPSGHTLLSEQERLETLQLLKKTQDEILRKMATLPLHFATLRAKQHKEELDKQLKKTEEGLQIFSRPRVLIKHDKS